MGNSRAGAAGGGTTLRETGQQRATDTATGDGSSAIWRGLRRKPRLNPGDKKARRHRRLRRFLITSAVIGAGLVAGLILGMISGIA